MIRFLLALALVGSSWAGGIRVSGGATARSGGQEAAEASSSAGPLYIVHKFGSNRDMAATEDIWSGGGTKSYLDLAGGSTITVSSSDANDDGSPAGTGARTVKVQGITLAGDWAAETVTLNGQAGVTLSTDFIRIVRQQVMTAGSGGANAGTIYVGTGTVTAGVPAVVVSEIDAGVNQTEQTHMSVPDGWTGYVHRYHASCSKADEFQLRLRVRSNSGSAAGPWRLLHEDVMYQGFIPTSFDAPLVVTGPADLKFDAVTISTGGTKRVFVNYELWMVND